MKRFKKNIFYIIAAIGGLSLTSCDSIIYDDADDCVQGVALQFRYEYHMEPGANAFPANVDCVNLFVFDSDGNYLDHFYETTEELKNENYRMQLPLKPGKYHLVAYGGLACENPRFNINHDWANRTKTITHKNDIEVTLPLNSVNTSATLLHDIQKRVGGLFYGTLDVTISDKMRWEFQNEVLYMMKDTNNIQVILQELSHPNSVDHEDYEFTIIDDNFKLDGYNNPISVVTDNNQPLYKPYNSENRVMGWVEYQERDGAYNSEDPNLPVQVGCVEFSTSRLFDEHWKSARLVIEKKKTKADEESKPIIDIPLIEYLEATRGFGQSWIQDDQEYLDRQSNWTLMFFLQDGRWVSTRISVNAWTVRINQTSFD